MLYKNICVFLSFSCFLFSGGKAVLPHPLEMREECENSANVNVSLGLRDWGRHQWCGSFIVKSLIISV